MYPELKNDVWRAISVTIIDYLPILLWFLKILKKHKHLCSKKKDRV